MLQSRLIAIQGIGFTAITMAVQGLFAGEVVVVPEVQLRREAVVGRGPGTTINYSDYIKQLKRGNAMLPNPTLLQIQEQSKRVRIARQRKQHRTVALASAVL